MMIKYYGIRNLNKITDSVQALFSTKLINSFNFVNDENMVNDF